MRYNRTLTSAVVLFTLIIAVSAQNATQSDCGFQGDDNAYGFGIRLGLYIQWITSSIAYNLVPEEAPAQRIVNTCFQLANFAGLLFITFTKGSYQPSGRLYAVEAYIVLMFCLCGVVTGKPDQNGDIHRTQNFALHKASIIGGVFQMAIGGALIYYAVWFAYIGMDQMLHPPCSQYAFFFTKVNLYDWFRTLLKVTFTISAVALSAYILILFAAMFFCFQKMPLWPTLKSILTSNFDAISPQQHEERKQTIKLLNLSMPLSMVFFILSTELAIRWNHIGRVNGMGSTGQILPIVAALASFVSVMWQLVVKMMRGDYDIGTEDDVQIGCCRFGAGSQRDGVAAQRFEPQIGLATLTG